mmetsp:Transcript_153/g.512  ORF Transcript_153/g.512 Transcript_153/m.512 type:complete len:213 (+) Transcript_153:666-1304(+)
MASSVTSSSSCLSTPRRERSVGPSCPTAAMTTTCHAPLRLLKRSSRIGPPRMSPSAHQAIMLACGMRRRMGILAGHRRAAHSRLPTPDPSQRSLASRPAAGWSLRPSRVGAARRGALSPSSTRGFAPMCRRSWREWGPGPPANDCAEAEPRLHWTGSIGTRPAAVQLACPRSLPSRSRLTCTWWCTGWTPRRCGRRPARVSSPPSPRCRRCT